MLFEDLHVEAGIEHLHQIPARVDRVIHLVFFNIPALHDNGQFQRFVATAYRELGAGENDPNRVIALIDLAPLRFLTPSPVEERVPRVRVARLLRAAPAA